VVLPAGVIVFLVVSGLGQSPFDATGSTTLHPQARPPTSGGSELAPGVNFPTYLDNNMRDGAANGETLLNVSNAPSLHLLWSYATHGDVASEPIAVNGVVYAGSWDGYEYALNATSGALIWKQFLGVDDNANDTACHSDLGITSTATISGSDLYVGGGNGLFYALNWKTGAIQWDYFLGNISNGYYNWASPLIYNGYAYVGLASACDRPLVKAGLDQISLKTHQLVNYFDTSVFNYTQYAPSNGSSIWSSPSLNPTTNTIFVTTGNPYSSTNMSACGAKCGNCTWGSTDWGSVYGEAIIALNATNLQEKYDWQVPTNLCVTDGDFGATPTLFTPSGPHSFPEVVATDKDGDTYAWYQSNLTEIWHRTIADGPPHSSATWGGGRVYVEGTRIEVGVPLKDYNGSVQALNPHNGNILWRDLYVKPTSGSYAAPIFDNGTVTVPVGDTLFVLNAATGKQLYSYEVNSTGFIQASVSISRGEIYAGSTTDDVYAFDLELQSHATQSSPSGPAPLTDMFDLTASGGLPAYTYNWSFGDGTYSNAQSPTHVYDRVGNYTVYANTTDLAGNRTSQVLTVVVTTAPASAPGAVRVVSIAATPSTTLTAAPLRREAESG
jgi:outer membrane protein assembly factor BamB